MSSKELKASARTTLAGKYSIFIGAYLLYTIITDIPITIFAMVFGPDLSITKGYGGFSSVSGLAMYLIVSALLGLLLSIFLLGFYKMALDGSRGYRVDLMDIFYGFRHHPDRVILLQLLLMLLQFACLLPGILLLVVGCLFGNPSLVILTFFSGILFLLVGFIPMIYFSLVFGQSMFLLADYDDLTAIQALNVSKKMMKGHKGRFFYIQCSLLGYYLLSLLSFGIATLWITPYQYMIFANFYRDLNGEYNNSMQIQ